MHTRNSGQNQPYNQSLSLLCENAFACASEASKLIAWAEW